MVFTLQLPDLVAQRRRPPSSQDSDSDLSFHLRDRCHHYDCTSGDGHRAVGGVVDVTASSSPYLLGQVRERHPAEDGVALVLVEVAG